MAGNGAPKQLWMLMATVFVDMVGLLLVLPLLPYYAKEYDAGGAAVGLLTSVFAAAQLLSAPIWGRLSDRWGRRPIILVGMLASAGGYLFFALSQALWMLYATRLLQGVGGGTIGVIQAYVSDAVEPKERAKALGWLTAAASTGVALGPALGSQLATWFGPQAPGFFAAALCLLNVLSAWRLLPEPARERSTASRRSLFGSLAEVVRHPALPASAMVWVYSLAMMAFMALQAILALYLMERFGVTKGQIGWFYTYVGVVSVLMRAWALGRILDRYGEVLVMRFGAFAMTLGFLLIPAAVHPALFIPVMTLIPVGTAMLFPTSTSMLTQRVRKEEVGQALGVQQSFRGISGIVGPAWAGAIFEFAGIRAPFLLCGAIMALVALVTLRIERETSAENEVAPAAPAVAADPP